MTKALIVVTPHAVIEHMNNMKLGGAAAPIGRASRGDFAAYEAGHRDGKASMKGGSKCLTE